MVGYRAGTIFLLGHFGNNLLPSKPAILSEYDPVTQMSEAINTDAFFKPFR